MRLNNSAIDSISLESCYLFSKNLIDANGSRQGLRDASLVHGEQNYRSSKPSPNGVYLDHFVDNPSKSFVRQSHEQ